MSLKKNIAYKGLLTFSNYIFGLITFPYVTRVLGPSNFGLTDFALNTVDYFLLFATLGINAIGTREIAFVKNDNINRNKVYSRLFGMNASLTFLVLLIYLLCICFVPQFRMHKELFWIGSAKIIFMVFAVEWLYTGLEEFKYIAIRSFLIRLIYVVLIFVFIKTSADYLIYFALTIGCVVINSIINFSYSFKFVKISRSEIISTHYYSQNFILGLYNIMTSMYITFNVMFLGLVSDNAQVGYYSAAVKMYFIAVNMFSAFTSVMLPRMSVLTAKNQTGQFKRYIDMSFKLVMTAAFPLIVFCFIFASQIIELFSGSEYQESVLLMRVLMPALLFVWLSQVIVLQGLMPLKKDKILLYGSTLGGISALLFNLILTKNLGALGSSITLVISEVVVITFYLIFVKRTGLISLNALKYIWKYAIATLPYILICCGCYYFIDNRMISMLICGCTCMICILGELKNMRNNIS